MYLKIERIIEKFTVVKSGDSLLVTLGHKFASTNAGC